MLIENLGLQSKQKEHRFSFLRKKNKNLGQRFIKYSCRALKSISF